MTSSFRYRPRRNEVTAPRLKNGGVRPFRLVGRRALLRALADEYTFGDSVSKLYVSLLARAVVKQEPGLLKKPHDPRLCKTTAQMHLERCGVELPV